jgi:hypothetical protein
MQWINIKKLIYNNKKLKERDQEYYLANFTNFTIQGGGSKWYHAKVFFISIHYAMLIVC